MPPFTRAREFCVAVFVHLRAVVVARRFPLIVLIHGTLMVAASYLALWLRFDGAIPQQLVSAYVQSLPELLLIRGMTFMAMGLGGGLWRYAGVWDLSRIFLATLTSSLALYLFIYAPLGPAGYPRSIVIIDSALLGTACGRCASVLARRSTIPSSVQTSPPGSDRGRGRRWRDDRSGNDEGRRVSTGRVSRR